MCNDKIQRKRNERKREIPPEGQKDIDELLLPYNEMLYNISVGDYSRCIKGVYQARRPEAHYKCSRKEIEELKDIRPGMIYPG